MPSRAPALAGFTGLGLFWGAFSSLLPAIQRSTGASKGELGIALLFITIGSLPAMLLTGRAVDRYGSRVAGFACALFAAGTALPGLATSVVALSAALVVAGAGSGALDVAVNARVARIEEQTKRRLMPLAHALYSVGVVVGAVGAGAFVVEGGLESWSALFLDREHDSSPAVSGLGPGLFALAMAAGRFSAQGAHRAHDRPLLVAGAVTAALGAAIVAASPNAPVALGGFALGGAGVSLAAPILFGAAGRGREHTGSAVATVTTLGYLGFLVGPPLMGGVSSAAGLRIGMLILAAFALTVAVGARGLPQDR